MTSLTENVTIRGYEPADGPQLLGHINEMFGTSLDHRYWDWKFHENPAGSALSCVVERENVIVAHFGGQPVRFMFDGDERLGVQDVDDFVDSAHRTFQGVFHVNKCRSELHREHGIDFMYGFSVEVTSKISQLQYGYGRVSSIPRLVKVLDWRPFLARSRATRFMAPLGAVANGMRRFRSRSDILPAGTELEKLERFDQRFDRFWDEIKHDYPIMVVRDAEYLNWRYVDVPHVETTRWAIVRSATKEVLGFLVVSENHENIPRGRILDLVTPRGSETQRASALLTFALDHFQARKLALVVAWVFPHCHLRTAFNSAGFRPRLDQGRDVMFRNADLKSPAISTECALNETNWFLSIGDSDMS